MDLNSTTNRVAEKAGGVEALGATVKFIMEEGVIFVDGNGDANVVSNDDKDADLDIDLKIDTFNFMMDGTLNPMTAVMNQDIVMDGDMSIAMKLTSLFAE